MENIFTCAIRYSTEHEHRAFVIPSFEVPQLYPAQVSLMFPNIEFTRSAKASSRNANALIWLYLFLERLTIMSGKKLPKNSKRDDFGVEFINYRLSTEEKADYTEWLQKTKPEFERVFVDMLTAEIKVGFSIDAQRSCFICSVTPKGEKDVNSGKCMISRSDEYDEALFINLYKMELFNATNKGLWASKDEDNNWG